MEQIYRAWIPSEKRMGEHFHLRDGLNDEGVFSDDIEFLQFTGKRGKNGVMIFDRDIIDVTQKYDDYVMYATVVWDEDEARWGYEKQDGDDTETGSLYDILDNSVEVVGNTYQNADLLKPWCRECGGKGYVTVMEEVEAGNPATMADVGERDCEACNGRGQVEDEE